MWASSQVQENRAVRQVCVAFIRARIDQHGQEDKLHSMNLGMTSTSTHMHFNMRAMPLPSLSFCHIYIQFVIFKDPIGNYASELGFALFLEIYFEIEREIQFLFF